jgi:hypothetical protein
VSVESNVIYSALRIPHSDLWHVRRV